HVLPDAEALARDDGARHAGSEEHRADLVREPADERVGRPARPAALLHHHPGERLPHVVVPRPVTPRPEPPPGGPRCQDDVFAQPSEVLVAEAPALHHAWPEVLHDHAEPGYEPSDRVTRGLDAEVERDALL